MKPEIDPVLRRSAVEKIVGLKRSAIYAGIKDGTFPRPIKLTSKAVGWRESEIREWLEKREATRIA